MKEHTENFPPLEAELFFTKQINLLLKFLYLSRASKSVYSQTDWNVPLVCTRTRLLESSLATARKMFKMLIHFNLVTSFWGIPEIIQNIGNCFKYMEIHLKLLKKKKNLSPDIANNKEWSVWQYSIPWTLTQLLKSSGVLLGHSRLRTQHCHLSSLGRCHGTGSVPGLRTWACRGHGRKNVLKTMFTGNYLH